jgi:4-amino-4-deoxy-L-arabinose transferase-like glycosyltransferase
MRGLVLKKPTVLIVAGFILRLAFVGLAGVHNPTFHSGGSDAPAYILIADNLLHGRGFSYNAPTAFRPPLYPLILAGAMAVFGKLWVVAVRLLQFAAGICGCFLCAWAAEDIFGERGKWTALLAGLFLPTLIFVTAQALTESLAAFFTSLFLFCLVRRRPWGMGASVGLASLIRFNSPPMVLVGAWHLRRDPIKAAIPVVVTILFLMPWLIRNYMVFDQVVYATQTGINAVQGIVAPQGRTQPSDGPKIAAALGPLDLKPIGAPDPSMFGTVSASVPETTANSRVLHIVPGLWREKGWHAGPLIARKLEYFWLSTDQLLDTNSLPWKERLIRTVGVTAYWLVLVAAILGWLRLRRTHPDLATTLLLYAVGFAVLHFPFVMNTRVRIPLIDPLLCVLAGGSTEKS